MPSDLTTAKFELWATAADGEFARTLDCPTCTLPMVVSPEWMLWAVGTGRMDWTEARYAEFSHLVPQTDGGKVGALECDRCNRDRGDVAWTAPEGWPTAREGKRAAGYAARGAARVALERERG